MCYDVTFRSSCRGALGLVVDRAVLSRREPVALLRGRVRGRDEPSPHVHLSGLRAGRSWPLPQIFAASAQLAWDDRTGLKGHA